MVAKITSNRLLFWTLIANAVYWAGGAVLPNPYVSSASSLILLITSAVMFLSYAPVALDILFNQKRDASEGGERAHIGVYGATLMAGGSCYVGLFGFLWVMAGQPDSWLGTAYSGYGRAVAAAGFALMAYSPDYGGKAGNIPRLIITIMMVIAIAVASFFLGTKVANQPEKAAYWKSVQGILANRPTCTESEPVWGSQSKVYHVEDSPYRGMVIPDWCFASTEEAEDSGFRAPKGHIAD